MESNKTGKSVGGALKNVNVKKERSKHKANTQKKYLDMMNSKKGASFHERLRTALKEGIMDFSLKTKLPQG